jgi:hypothetical protein
VIRDDQKHHDRRDRYHRRDQQGAHVPSMPATSKTIPRFSAFPSRILSFEAVGSAALVAGLVWLQRNPRAASDHNFGCSSARSDGPP